MQEPKYNGMRPITKFLPSANIKGNLQQKAAASCHWLGAMGLMGLALSPRTALATKPPLWEDLPGNTALVLSINTSQASWEDLERFRTAQLLNETLDITPNPGGLPYLPYSLDYQTHIQPWVGSQAVVALLPALAGSPANLTDHSVMLAPIRDRDAFNNYFQMLSDLQAAPTVETFRQTEILFWPGNSGPGPDALLNEQQGIPKTLSLSKTLNLSLQVTAPKALSGGTDTFDLDIPLPIPQPTATGLAVAVLPNALVAAENPQAIKTFLRYRQDSQETLINNPQFQRTLAHPQRGQALITVYGNALELLNFSPPEVPLPLVGFPVENGDSSAAIETLRTLNFGGTLEALLFPAERGIQFQGRFYYDTTPFTFGLTDNSPQADSVLEHLPASTYLLMSGRDLAGLWQQMTHTAELLNEDWADGLATVRQGFTTLTGLDLDQDVFGWMDGEIAFAAYPARDTPFQALAPQLQLGLGLLLQTSDRTSAVNTLDTADELFTTLGFGVMPETVNNQPITSWDLGSGWDASPEASRQGFLSRGWVTKDTLAIVSGPGTMERVMNPSPHDPLGSFPLFQNAVAPFPAPNNGYFYVNVGATLALIYQAFNLHQVEEFQPFKPFLGSFNTFSATTSQTADYITLDAQLGLALREAEVQASN